MSLLEVGLRLDGYDRNTSPHWRYDSEFGWTSDPDGLSMAGKPIRDVLPSGFRHHVRKTAKPRGVKRLLILGDSFTLASRFPYAHTYPGRLEAWLNQGQEGESWQVLSLNADDWGNAQQLLALTRHGLQYAPDAVVLQVFPLNDFCNNSLILAHTCSHQDDHRPYFVFDRQGGNPSTAQLRLTSVSPTRTWLRDRLFFFAAAENTVMPVWRGWPGSVDESPEAHQRRQDYFQNQAERVGLRYPGVIYSLLPEPHQPPPIRQAWGITERIFQRIRQVLDERGIPLLVMVVPFSQTFQERWPDFAQLFQVPLQADHGTGWVEERFRSWGVPVISVRQCILAGETPSQDFFISPDDGHFNPFGHFMAAQWILGELHRLQVTAATPPGSSLPSTDLLQEEAPPSLVLLGFDGISTDGYGRWRLAMGPRAEIAFQAAAGQAMQLQFRLHNLIVGQRVSLLINHDQALPPMPLDSLGKQEPHSISFQTIAGLNVISFLSDDWNWGRSVYFERDNRPIALNFSSLKLSPQTKLDQSQPAK
ncbi:MAG TPA: hypothetical protein VLV83_12545 [Acidobacteriota bacterium]|nr:hypothetical protein [Acidobacteriota bacterium]